MPDEGGIPRLRPDEFKRRANEFLLKYHASRAIPVPIEEIVEFGMRLDIIPVPGLGDCLRSQDIELVGFTTSDMKEIHVDEFVYLERPARYRFTLAHEASHILLHPQFFCQAAFDSFQTYAAALNGIPSKDVSRMEYQAHCLAGLILVPEEHLRKLAGEALSRDLAKSLPEGEDPDFIREFIARSVCKAFDVSPEVIARRLKFEDIP